MLITMGERLKWLRKDKKLTLEQVEEGCGVKRATLARMEKDEGRAYADSIIEVADFYSASLEWILRGNGQPYNQLQASDTLPFDLLASLSSLSASNLSSAFSYVRFLRSEQSTIQSDENHYENYSVNESTNKYHVVPSGNDNKLKIYVPILGSAAAGNPILAEEFIDGFVPISDKTITGNTYLIRVQGDSMINANIHDGDLVLVKSQPVVENGEIALVMYDGLVTVKYFYCEDHQVRLKPANPKYDDLIVKDLDIFKILGKIEDVISKDTADRLKQEFNM